MDEEEITKEIKNINELETTPVQEDVVEEKEVVEEASVEQQEPVEEKPKDKKKLWIIIGIVVAVLLLIIILLIVLIPKNKKTDESKKKSNDSRFVASIKSSIESGEFDKAIKKGLSANDIKADSVCILRMDLDSDGDAGLVVYAEDSTNKAIIQLEVDESVSYDDSFPVDAKDSIGYVYSSEKRESYWYTEYTKSYTIISTAKKIIKEEDFLNDYFALTKTYQEKPILDHCMEYKFDQELDAKEIEKNAITVKKLLEDNNIKEDEISDAYKKYLTEKEEKEKKEKEEAEQKAKEEEQAKKLSGTFRLGDRSYNYGTYQLYTVDNAEDGKMLLYSDGTCSYKEKACTFQIEDIRGSQDELVPGISLSNGKSFMASEDNGVLIEPAESFLARYTG